MTAPVKPYVDVAPPGAAPARFGLFSASTVIEGVEGHQLNGIQYEAVCSSEVTPYPFECQPGQVKEAKPTTSVITADPFSVYAADSCVFGRDQATAINQLRQRFTTGETRLVEETFWSGFAGNRPYLADPATVWLLDGGTTPQTSLARAVGLLEDWLAETTGANGVIHAPRYLGSELKSQSISDRSGPRLQTPLGNVLALGGGYPGTPPSGVDAKVAGKIWLFASRPVTVRRSGLIEPATWSTGGFDQSTNAGFLLIERIYLADFPCEVAAVPLDRVRPSEPVRPTPPPGTELGVRPAKHTTSHISEEK